mmetsp:Transcript_20887/g.48893  ORF Transcript_20887/g.48893 Transcript_20887/m.48893 type:complete len:240 (+) Transcript_20887:320-1039(+)
MLQWCDGAELLAGEDLENLRHSGALQRHSTPGKAARQGQRRLHLGVAPKGSAQHLGLDGILEGQPMAEALYRIHGRWGKRRCPRGLKDELAFLQAVGSCQRGPTPCMVREGGRDGTMRRLAAPIFARILFPFQDQVRDAFALRHAFCRLVEAETTALCRKDTFGTHHNPGGARDHQIRPANQGRGVGLVVLGLQPQTHVRVVQSRKRRCALCIDRVAGALHAQAERNSIRSDTARPTST